MREMGVYFLDVGQGDASIVIPPDGEGNPILFDCRDSHVIINTLRNWNIEVLDALIISHLDWDHIDGALAVLKQTDITIRKVFVSADREITNTDDKSAGAKAMVDEAMAGAASNGRHSGKRWELYPNTRPHQPILKGVGWNIQLLAPEHRQVLNRERTGHWEDANHHSAVLRVSMGDRALLIGGDAPLVTWAKINEEERVADVFRIPHHGGAVTDGGVPEGWDVERLYSSVGARNAAISVGTNNPHDHPDPQWIGPICGGACRLICTQVTERCQPGIKKYAKAFKQRVMDTGDIGGHFAEAQWRHFKDAKNLKGPLSRREVPCAGTIVVKMSEDNRLEILPLKEAHSSVVQQWDQPMCMTF